MKKKSHPTILFYVSGHGFGHSTRAIEVARRLPEEVRVIFKTSAPLWLYECYCDRPFEFHAVDLDVGVVQEDSLTLNGARTLEAYAELAERSPSLIEQESRFVQSEDVNLIVGDIPPIAFEIAHHCGVPSVCTANFSWDWIYGPYVKRRPEYAWVVERIKAAYSKCDLLLRLPFFGDLSAFPCIEDIPLVVRSPQGNPATLRRQLGFDPERRLAVLSFGGFDLERIPWDRVEKMTGYQFVYFRYAVPAKNVIHVTNGRVPHVNMVQMADLVMTKPGYGICAECIRTQTPMVYTDRGEFLEYEFLVEGMERFGRAEYIPQEELLAGRWESWLERTADLPAARESMRTDGGQVAAKRIMEMCRR